jgi:hypothetical protein
LVLKGEPFRSLQSGYKGYEQQNINQYISVRNAIADQLLNFYDRANVIAGSFGSGFQKALALITFYSSIIVVKIFSKLSWKTFLHWTQLSYPLSSFYCLPFISISAAGTLTGNVYDSFHSILA